jgi:hypothetical protein
LAFAAPICSAWAAESIQALARLCGLRQIFLQVDTWAKPAPARHVLSKTEGDWGKPMVLYFLHPLITLLLLWMAFQVFYFVLLELFV